MAGNSNARSSAFSFIKGDLFHRLPVISGDSNRTLLTTPMARRTNKRNRVL